MQNIVQTVLQKMGNVSKSQLKVWTILLTIFATSMTGHKKPEEPSENDGKVDFSDLSRFTWIKELDGPERRSSFLYFGRFSPQVPYLEQL